MSFFGHFAFFTFWDNTEQYICGQPLRQQTIEPTKNRHNKNDKRKDKMNIEKKGEATP